MPWNAALHVAAQNGDLPLAQTLIRLGVDPDERYQSIPLGWARHVHQPVLVELLEPLTTET